MRAYEQTVHRKGNTSIYLFIYSCIYLFFLPYLWHAEFPKPGWNLYHSSDLSRSSDDTGSLTH